jgi:hypothetical protein
MGMRTGIDFTVSSEDRRRIEALVPHPSSPQKQFWAFLLIGARLNATG